MRMARKGILIFFPKRGLQVIKSKANFGKDSAACDESRYRARALMSELPFLDEKNPQLVMKFFIPRLSGKEMEKETPSGPR